MICVNIQEVNGMGDPVRSNFFALHFYFNVLKYSTKRRRKRIFMLQPNDRERCHRLRASHGSSE